MRSGSSSATASTSAARAASWSLVATPAIDDGTLTKQYVDAPGALAGNGWRLQRADGTYFFYAHLERFADGVAPGVQVAAGTLIGYVGSTGNAAGPHLHLEVHPKVEVR